MIIEGINRLIYFCLFLLTVENINFQKSFSVGYEQMSLKLMKNQSSHSKNLFHAKIKKKNDEGDFKLFATYTYLEIKILKIFLF